MPPHRASSADSADLQQTPAQVAAAIEDFLAHHADAAVVEDGKVVFDLRPGHTGAARFTLSTEHERCMLHLWSDERNLVRRVLSATTRNGCLRLATQRFGHAKPKLLELVC